MKYIFTTIFAFLVLTASTKEYQAVIRTTKGKITVKLYNQTPLHRDNFVKLARKGFFNGLLFHRVIADFMIQGGDPHSRNAAKGALLGEGDLGYRVPAEFVPQYSHKVGVLAAARLGDDENPKQESSASQFYITVAPVERLDGMYTIFGELVDGQQVADAISLVATDANDRPLKNVRIRCITIREIAL